MKKHNNNLDILRGVAAIVVMLFHMVERSSMFDKKYTLGLIDDYNFPGHLSVIVFFILSGYVIGMNHPEMNGGGQVKDYIKKRLLRIVPIYFTVLFITILFFGKQYSPGTIISNLFFVSVPLGNVMSEDAPLWSLNFELIYYFVYILFAWYKIDLSKTVKALLIITGIVFLFFHNVKIHPLLIGYLIGFIFWITGAMIAKIKTWPEWHITSSRIISIFLLIFCLQPFNPYGPVLKILHIHTPDYSSYSLFQTEISYNDLFFYPLTVLLILSLTHSYSKFSKFLIYFTFGGALLRLGMLYWVYGMAYMLKVYYFIPALTLFLSILLWALNFQINTRVKRAIKSTAPLSKISYALYLVHLPVYVLFGWVTVSTPFYFVLKVLAYFIVVIMLSYLLEVKYQPYIKELFSKKKTLAVKPVEPTG